MTLLVTGSAGQVGRAVVRLAEARGFPVRGLGRDRLDITEPGDVQAAMADTPGLALVVNAAAFTDVDAAEERSEEAFRVNRDGPVNLAHACRRARVPLVHLSTDYVFDGRSRDVYDETDPPAPLNVYGRSKLAGEAAVRGLIPEHVILRTSWVFGWERRNFVRSMLRLARERTVVEVVSDQEGCPTGADQVAEALLVIAEKLTHSDRRPRGTFHLAGRPSVSRAAFARHVFDEARAAGLPWARVREVPGETFAAAARRPARVVLGGRRTREELGIEPPDWRPSLTAAVRELERREVRV